MDARQKSVQHPASLSDKCSRTDLLLVGPCIERFEDSLLWQTERVFRFVCTVGKRLQAPDLPFYFYSESSSRPFVSPVEWARSSKLQAFSFTSTAGQRLQAAGLPFHLCRGPEAPGSRPTVSVKVQFCSGQSSRLQVRGYTVSRIQKFKFQLNSMPVDARQKCVVSGALSDERKHTDSTLWCVVG